MNKDGMTDDPQEIWSAIRYLDPDEKDPEAVVAMIGSLVLALVIALVVIELRLRGL